VGVLYLFILVSAVSFRDIGVAWRLCFVFCSLVVVHDDDDGDVNDDDGDVNDDDGDVNDDDGDVNDDDGDVNDDDGGGGGDVEIEGGKKHGRRRYVHAQGGKGGK
jgi:hypothetical protein